MLAGERVAAEFNRAGETASRQGIKIGFHNHDGDHVPLGSTTGFDILLADRCLKAGATVIAPTGKPFTANSIGAAIVTRAIMADLRAGGVGEEGEVFDQIEEAAASR